MLTYKCALTGQTSKFNMQPNPDHYPNNKWILDSVFIDVKPNEEFRRAMQSLRVFQLRAEPVTDEEEEEDEFWDVEDEDEDEW